MHTASLKRRIDILEDTLDMDHQNGPWCPDCGHGQQLVVLPAGTPEPICETCGQPRARRRTGIRVIVVPDTRMEKRQ